MAGKHISILGCGWLGLPLAKHLIKLGYSVKGSTTTAAKTESLKQQGIVPYLVKLGENNIEGDIKGLLEDTETLIIDIPPGLRSNSNANFTAKIERLIPHIEEAQVKNVLFVSSTSVYGDSQGIVTEDTEALPATESGRQLLETEQLLQENKMFNTTIIRFGGLIGEDRHPVNHLAGKENIKDADAPINLIHQTDCIGIITAVIEKGIWGEIFNGVAPYHPSRKEYYTEKAKQKNLPLPLFSREEASGVKVIAADKVTEVLKFRFKFAEL
ncbi:SDR family oxidoreductase [Flavobacterium sp. D11R37]|uniref:SDR family oxidoreductase n=1 Tax=Flavobacterium coralii TaxID=2838017 RepID=UPI001CA6B50E|nr:SDR family oxidoreductase [Flavobacterium coralii]MBY8963046.1 SDR family oxidoreductase [Flavobacterium coralii]